MRNPKKTASTGKKKVSPLRFDILTIFPQAFDSYFEESLVKRAREKKLIEIEAHDLRNWSTSRHKKVDDKPFGGGPGMVIQVEPVWRALADIRKKKGKQRVILFSTRGKKFDASMAKRLSAYDQLILICGRYEGVDERVAEHIADEEISMGDYVLSGGELPAMILVEAVSRFRPGFLGKYESLEDKRGSFPAYSRPEVFSPGKGKKPWVVPKVLLSGNHATIEAWRKRSSPRGESQVSS
jgi:tRNA (guanine37-N1)-methyltransferase